MRIQACSSTHIPIGGERWLLSRTRRLAALAAVVAAGSRSRLRLVASSEQQRPRRHRHQHHVRHPSAADRPGRARLQRDRARLAGVLQLRQRPRRRVRAQDPPDHQGRRLQPDQHGQRRSPARAPEQRVRDLRGPRHADAHQGGRLPERLEGARHLRGLGLPVLGQRHEPAVHVRLAAQLHDRGQDPRPVPQAALRRQEDRRPLPGRRLRPGRPGRDPGRGPGLDIVSKQPYQSGDDRRSRRRSPRSRPPRRR